MARRCELCDLVPVTHWYEEASGPVGFVVLDCESCEVPMAVLRAHRAVPTPEERQAMIRALARVADAKYPQGWFLDDHMRQIPDHYHVHARPRWRLGR